MRLAHILLDSAVELIMHRTAEAEVESERLDFDQPEKLHRLDALRESDKPLDRRFGAAGPRDDQLRVEIRGSQGL